MPQKESQHGHVGWNSFAWLTASQTSLQFSLASTSVGLLPWQALTAGLPVATSSASQFQEDLWQKSNMTALWVNLKPNLMEVPIRQAQITCDSILFRISKSMSFGEEITRKAPWVLVLSCELLNVFIIDLDEEEESTYLSNFWMTQKAQEG